MDNDKKRGRSRLVQNSLIVSTLTRFSAWLYAAVLSGFFGLLFTSYRKAATGFADSWILSKLRHLSAHIKDHPVSRLKHSIASIYEQSFVLGTIRALCGKLLTMYVTSFGLFAFSYGFTVIIIHLLKLYTFHVEMESPYRSLIVGLAVMVVGILLFFSKKSAAALLYESRTARFLLFDLLGMQMYPLAKAAKEEAHHGVNGALIIGLLLGGMTAFTDALLMPIICAAFLLLVLILHSPESAIILVFLTLPFLTTMQLVYMMCLIYLSFLLKLICGRRVFRLHLIDYAALVFMGFIFFGGIYSVDNTSFEKMCVFLCFMFGFFVVKNTQRSPALVERCISAFIASGVLVALIGLYQNFFGNLSLAAWLDTKAFSEIEKRVVSTFGNPNVLGEYLILLFPLILARLMSAKRGKERFVYLVAGALVLSCLVFTWSRGAWLGFILSMIVFFVISGKQYFTAGILAIPLVGTGLYFSMGTAIMNRFTNLTDSSSSYRLNIWRGVLRMLDEVGIMGIGIGEGAFRMIYPAYSLSGIETAPHSHNLFLQLIVETGIFSLIAFLIFLFFHAQCTLDFCKNAYSPKNKMISLGFFAGALAFLVQGMTDYVWYNYRILLLFWLLLGLGLAHIKTANSTEEESVLYH